MPQWIEEVRSICGPHVPVILVGCKADLLPPPHQQRRDIPDDQLPYVTRARGEAVASAIGARTYRECSSMRNEGVDDVFEAATRASMLVSASGESAGGCRCVVC